MKTLYFEGAGCVPRGDLENCRIRTAFTLDNGSKVYLEITGFEAGILKNRAHVDHLHFITTADIDDDNWNRIALGRSKVFEYDRKSLLQFVNDLGASFDDVQILPDLAGYRVHGDNRKYNFADEFVYNVERTKQAEKIKQYFYDKEKESGKKYPCFSIWFPNVEESETLNVRFFDGRGTMEIPDVFSFDFK